MKEQASLGMQTARKIIIAVTLLIMTLCSWFALLDAPSSKLVDEGLERAFVSFATARALNAAISFGQGTEVAIQPMGVGVTLTPGQLLDPVNDLVENFSSLMMAACIALGAQKMLINIGGHWLVSMLLTMTVLAWSWFYFRQQQPFAWLSKILVILLMVRFAIPLVTIATDMLSQKYLIAEYKANQKVIDKAPKEVTEFKFLVAKGPDNTGIMAGVKDTVDAVNRFLSKAKEAANVELHYKKLQQAAEQWAKHIINLIVIFLLQTLVIPVLLIWILYTIARSAFSRS